MMEVYDYREMRLHRPEDFYDASFVAQLDQSGYIDGLYKGGAAPQGNRVKEARDKGLKC